MKPSLLLLVFLLLAGISGPTRAAEADAATTNAANHEVTIELMVVQMPQDLATSLIASLRRSSDAVKAYEQALQLIVEGRAKLVGWPIVTTKNGQRAVVEQIEELRYPTEFQSPTVAVYRNDYDQEPEVQEPGKPIKSIKVDVTPYDAIPTSFDTRNLGVTLEVEPVVSPDGSRIDLNLHPQSVRLIRMEATEIEMQPSGRKVTTRQPLISTNKVTTSISTTSGEVRLLGVFMPADLPKTMELMILRTEMIQPAAPGTAKETDAK